MPSARLVALLEAGGNVVPFTTCLSKALAGSMLMYRHGYDTRLHIGVAKNNDDGLEAHAWLTLGARIIVGNCPDMQRFRELPPFRDVGAGRLNEE